MINYSVLFINNVLGYVILVFKKVPFSNESNNVHLISNVLVLYLLILTMVGVRNPKSIYYHNLNIYYLCIYNDYSN